MNYRNSTPFTGKPSMATHPDGAGSPHFRPGPAEAFAMAYRAIDEGDTVVWSNEMAAAWGLAMPLVLASDVAGGRMAFIERYSRDVDAACKAGRPPVWMVSLGLDPTRRAPALLLAAQAGIPVDALSEVARGGKIGRTAPEGTGDQHVPPSPKNKADFEALRKELEARGGAFLSTRHVGAAPHAERRDVRLTASNCSAAESRRPA